MKKETKMDTQSPYHDQVNVPVTLSCGCETVWQDGFDLWHPGQDAYCQQHGDAEVASIDRTEGRE